MALAGIGLGAAARPLVAGSSAVRSGTCRPKSRNRGADHSPRALVPNSPLPLRPARELLLCHGAASRPCRLLLPAAETGRASRRRREAGGFGMACRSFLRSPTFSSLAVLHPTRRRDNSQLLLGCARNRLLLSPASRLRHGSLPRCSLPGARSRFTPTWSERAHELAVAGDR